MQGSVRAAAGCALRGNYGCAADALTTRPPAPSPAGRRFQRPPSPHGAGRGCRAFLGGAGTATTRRARAMFFSSGSPARLAGSAVPPRRLRLIPPRAPSPPTLPRRAVPQKEGGGLAACRIMHRTADMDNLFTALMYRSAPVPAWASWRRWRTGRRRPWPPAQRSLRWRPSFRGRRDAAPPGRRARAAVPPCRPRTMLRPLRPPRPPPRRAAKAVPPRAKVPVGAICAARIAPRGVPVRGLSLGSETPPRHRSTRLPCG